MSAGSLLTSEYVATVPIVSSVETIDGLSVVRSVIEVFAFGDTDDDQLSGLFELGTELFRESGRGFIVAGSEDNQSSDDK